MEDRRCFLVDVKSVWEPDGRLLVVEGNSGTIPFDIKRIFWVRDVTKHAQRGQHATKKTKLVLIPVSGSCDVAVNDGFNETVYHMDDSSTGLYIDAMLWRTMKNFTPDCVMMAVCDRIYSPGDETFENFEEYKKALGETKKLP